MVGVSCRENTCPAGCCCFMTASRKGSVNVEIDSLGVKHIVEKNHQTRDGLRAGRWNYTQGMRQRRNGLPREKGGFAEPPFAVSPDAPVLSESRWAAPT